MGFFVGLLTVFMVLHTPAYGFPMGGSSGMMNMFGGGGSQGTGKQSGMGGMGGMMKMFSGMMGGGMGGGSKGGMGGLSGMMKMFGGGMGGMPGMSSIPGMSGGSGIPGMSGGNQGNQGTGGAGQAVGDDTKEKAQEAAAFKKSTVRDLMNTIPGSGSKSSFGSQIPAFAMDMPASNFMKFVPKQFRSFVQEKAVENKQG